MDEAGFCTAADLAGGGDGLFFAAALVALLGGEGLSSSEDKEEDEPDKEEEEEDATAAMLFFGVDALTRLVADFFFLAGLAGEGFFCINISSPDDFSSDDSGF